MESLGEFLKEARLNINVSLEEIARETHISEKYLKALEDEEFSVFPGETYLKGFLKTYCRYLKLNPEEIINIYERIRIAETPTPLEKLIPKHKMNLKPVFTISTAALVLLGIILLSVIGIKNSMNKKNSGLFSSKKHTNKIIKDKQGNEITIYQAKDSGKEEIFNLKKGDIINFELKQKKYELKIKKLSPTVVIDYLSDKELFLIRKYQHKVDLDNDNIYDVELVLNFWDNKSANVSIKVGTNEKILDNLKDFNIAKGKNSEIIAQKIEPEKFNLSIEVQSPTFVRYKIDQEDEIENFYNKTNIKNLSATHRIIVWIANAGAVEFNFPNYDKKHIPGNPGEVAVKIIEWKESSPGDYELQVISAN